MLYRVKYVDNFMKYFFNYLLCIITEGHKCPEKP